MVGASCLTVEPHHYWSLMSEPLVYTVRSCDLLVCWMRSLISESALMLAIVDSVFQSFLAGGSHRDAFPTPWFAWVRSAGIPAYWLLCLTHSRLCLFTRCWALWTQKLGSLCWKPRAGKGSPFKGLEQVRKWPCMLHTQPGISSVLSFDIPGTLTFLFSRSSPYLFSFFNC